MPKKKYESLLENLFTNLEREREQVPSSSNRPLRGWEWECDGSGLYTSCSEDVYAYLGVMPERFIGKPFGRFLLTPDSIEEVQTAIQENNLPITIHLEYYSKYSPKPVAVMLQISPREPAPGWRGIARVLRPEIAPSAGRDPVEKEYSAEKTRAGTSAETPPDRPEASGSAALRAHNVETQPSLPSVRRKDRIKTGRLGLLMEGDVIQPTKEILTPAGEHSLETRQTVLKNAESGEPAELALALAFEEGATDLLLELMDESENRQWSEDETLLVEQVADQLSLALENARLFEQTRERAHELSLLREVSLELAGEQRDLSAVLDIISRRAMELLDSDGSGVWMWNEEAGALELVVTSQDGTVDMRGRRLQPGEGLSGAAFSTRLTQVVEDYPVWSGQSLVFRDAPFHAAISVPMIWQSDVVGVFTLTRSQRGYTYTHNEQHLAELLAGQAAAIIQNARLYTEEQRRRKEADALRQTAQLASSTLDVYEVADLMIDQLAHLLEFQNASIHLIENGKRNQLSSRSYSQPLSPIEETKLLMQLEQPIEEDRLLRDVYTSRQPLLLADTYSDPRWDVSPENQHIRSWLAAPMVVGEQALGFILLDHNQAGVYTEETVSLVQTIAAQVAVAVQNALLYQDAQSTRDMIAVRERYQAAVASATALLTQGGTDVLDRVLQILCEGARASRAYYFETYNDKGQLFWKVRGLWCVQGMPAPDYNTLLGQQPVRKLFSWGEILRTEGRISGLVAGFPEAERRFLEKTGTRSMLLLAVPSKQEIPGCIGFDELGYEREWTLEEATVLQTAASALSNTIAREDLFAQVELNLAETERLYNASRLVSAARDLQEIVTAAVKGLEVTGINRAVLHVFDQDARGRVESVRVAANWYSGSGNRPTPLGTVTAGTEVTGQAFLTSAEPFFCNDVENDDRLDQVARTFLQKDAIGAFAVLPLWVGAHQLGTLMLQSQQNHIFSSRDERSYPALMGQMAAAVQNRLLFEQTEVALSQTEDLYRASAELNAAADYEDILHVLRAYSVLGDQRASQVTITLFDQPWTMDTRPNLLIPIAHWQRLRREKSPDQRLLRDWDMPESFLDAENVIVFENAAGDARLSGREREEFVHNLGARGLIFAPLNVTGQWIGLITGVYSDPTTFSDVDIRRLGSLAGQAAVSIQNMRLLEETRVRNEELNALNRIISSASSTLDVPEMLAQVLLQLTAAVPFDAGVITVVASGDTELSLAAQYNLPEPLRVKLERGEMRGTPCQIVYDQNKPVVAGNLADGFQGQAEDLLGNGLRAYIGVPVQSKGKTLGTVCLFHREPVLNTEPALALMQPVGQQLGVALENASLFQQTELALAETEVLYEASAALNSAQAYEDILQVFRDHTVLGKADQQISINVFDQPWRADYLPKWIVCLASWGDEVNKGERSRYPLSSFPAAENILLPDRISFVGSSAGDPRLDESAQALYEERFGSGSTLFVPLVAAGQFIGYINGCFGKSRTIHQAEIRRLMALATGAGVAVENLRLLDESRRRAEQLQTAAEIARDTSSTLALDTLLKRIVKLVCDRFNYSHASIYLQDEEDNLYMVVAESTGAAGEEMKRRKHRVAVGSRSIIGSVTESGEPMVVNDVRNDPIHQQNPLLPDTRAELGIPLRISDRIIGALDVQAAKVDAFSTDDVQVLMVLADQIAVAVDNARSYELAQKAVEEIRELDHLKSQFLANMSHELRTPLNSIIGFSRVILKGIDGPVSDLQKQDLTAIYNSGQHLLGLINDVLDLSKIEAGKMELAFDDQLNLHELINSVMSTLVGLIKDKPIKMLRDVTDDLPTVRADPMKVRQVLINLLSNAAKFTEEGWIQVEARVQTDPSGLQEVLVGVRDTGPGISREDQEKLFQPFTQVDGSLTRKTGGTGLGLSICRHLMDMHGGRIGVESTEGEGSFFYFTLPLVHNSIQDRVREPQNGERVILCIDDDDKIIQLYERYLENHGFQVVGLSDPSSAVQRAASLKPYAITLDILMPDLDGWEVLKRLKQDRRTEHIPVIICSILENQQKGFSLGAAEYLMKPILQEELTAAVNYLNGSGQIHDVLVIDDDSSALRLVSKIFSGQEQYILRTAHGGAEGLDTIRRNAPDAIILDLFMPDVDGFSVLETLKSDRTLRHIPVIILTGEDLTAEQKMRLKSFGETMLRKGMVSGEEVLSTVERVLNTVLKGSREEP